VGSDPGGGELKKSRRNRGVLHSDLHVSEVNVFPELRFCLLHLDGDSFLLKLSGLDHAARETASRLTSTSNMVPNPLALQLR
jgi:hypothetical protein